MTTGALMTAARDEIGLLGRLRHAGARRWYAGASVGLVYQAFEVVGVWSAPGTTVRSRVVATAALAAFYLLYLVVPPLVWPEREAVRVGATLGLLVLSGALFPVVGPTAMWVWLLILSIAAFTWSSQVAGLVLAAAVSGVALGVAALLGFPDSIAATWWICLSVGTLMVAFGQQVRQTVRLRAANDEIARLAVDDERARFARDLHDSLGHSLTVVAVKSELAGKLIDRDATAARAEIADVERLARAALADLRESVTGFRGVTLDGEVAVARTALAAGRIALVVVGRPEVVREDLRALFAWTVREGVTNVLRHATAATCTIELTRTRVRIRDDGTGIAGASTGSGLRGLAERAAAAGARLNAGPRSGGGFELRVSR